MPHLPVGCVGDGKNVNFLFFISELEKFVLFLRRKQNKINLIRQQKFIKNG